ncbi:M14 family zinc carboxypeptidase [Confluentibacter flavum]|uniref:Peptidase M14 n=1 Tax=Confluentibacter flavum TaxID=1909700 RepID=A0A2N3HGI2_9FLAO|nr:M14 family zinc carboxypeptidase [Confluentibacter flavum]PKQ44080.1 peptidase M14 [Confluentibacter flavum]
MKVEAIQVLFSKFKEDRLFHRYITNNHIEPLLKNLGDSVAIKIIGTSVLKQPIYSVTIGSGKKKILMWSQMHGNESTTTKAIFDLLNTFISAETSIKHILEACTICCIPILNPDGAEAYTRVNANDVDLNRDAQLRSQPESKVLRTVYEDFNPDFCYNLHGQRTIFSAGKTNKPATVSFLAPAQDEACTITPNRMIAMEIISNMNDMLQQVIPNQVGVYDDAFNLNCVGDTFQSENKPTILFEAGHYFNDYEREQTRKYIYMSLLTSLDYISTVNVDGSFHKPYFDIPENDKCFLDIIIRNAKIDSNSDVTDIGIQFQERLVDGKVFFIPKIEKIENLDLYYGHREIDAKGHLVLDDNYLPVKINYENDFVILNNKKTPILSK